jgi:hypothetical protein
MAGVRAEHDSSGWSWELMQRLVVLLLMLGTGTAALGQGTCAKGISCGPNCVAKPIGCPIDSASVAAQQPSPRNALPASRPDENAGQPAARGAATVGSALTPRIREGPESVAVRAPAPRAAPPAPRAREEANERSLPTGASAKCRDGTYSFSAHRRGTCSHHGGVAVWLGLARP